ncbi:TRAP transporter small permease [Marinobacter oulmenensis]|uniref:TRAP transporter small permease protein n=1 Tax=Marinobacter oulmenensis TaxID=643747 RepID=A0A840ULJ9_9GAMM|nr:TRAP transporter small permease subunit [Marinobacter oulmenensis]MBB5321727.1 TRAP-type C4-dicarboxylate transport system permease small subunit [Marinobacter oulmenensis]
MSRFASIVDAISRVMLLVSGFMITAMMLVVLAEVSTRALFGLTDGSLDLTFNGGIEIARFALLFAILYALPCNVDRSQVVVDLFTNTLSDRSIAVLQSICFIGYGLLALAMSYRFWGSVGHSYGSGETTQDLNIPMFYIYAATLVGTGMLCLRSGLVAVRRIREAIGITS